MEWEARVACRAFCLNCVFWQRASRILQKCRIKKNSYDIFVAFYISTAYPRDRFGDVLVPTQTSRIVQRSELELQNFQRNLYIKLIGIYLELSLFWRKFQNEHQRLVETTWFCSLCSSVHEVFFKMRTPSLSSLKNSSSGMSSLATNSSELSARRFVRPSIQWLLLDYCPIITIARGQGRHNHKTGGSKKQTNKCVCALIGWFEAAPNTMERREEERERQRKREKMLQPVFNQQIEVRGV